MGSVSGSVEDSESTEGDFSSGEGRRMKTTCWTCPITPPALDPAIADGMAPAVAAAAALDPTTPTPTPLKKPAVEVGVEEVSSLSEAHSGLELPLRLGPAKSIYVLYTVVHILLHTNRTLQDS